MTTGYGRLSLHIVGITAKQRLQRAVRHLLTTRGDESEEVVGHSFDFSEHLSMGLALLFEYASQRR